MMFRVRPYFTVSSNNKEISDKISGEKGKISKSKVIGKLTAEKAIAQKINDVVFDRNGYLIPRKSKSCCRWCPRRWLKVLTESIKLFFLNLFDIFSGRLMAGQRPLEPLAEVRILP